MRLTEIKEALAKQSRYALGHSEQELERLSRQAEIFEPFTRQLLQQAGISRGMRVLDVGCGSGDVTLLASELVGPSGKVIGADQAIISGAASHRARTRAADWECAILRRRPYSVFVDAGLPGPSMRMDAVIGGRPDCPAFELTAESNEKPLTSNGKA